VLDIKGSLFFLAITFALAGVFAGCKKDSNGNGPGSRQDLIASAKQFFEKEVAPITLQNALGIGGRTKKTPLWRGARMINLSIGPAVVVPLGYERKVTVTPSFSGGQSFSLEAMTKLLIYKGRDNRDHALVITGLPDGVNNVQKGQYFSGIIVSEDWAGNPVKDYRFSGGKIFARIKKAGPSSPAVVKEIQGQKAVTTIIETCYYFTTCIGTVDNPYMSCSTQDLGCTDEYIGEDQSVLDDGSGGGGISGADAGGAVTYVDPNTFSGNPCKTTPDLTVSGSNLTATTVNTGVFTLANVKVAFDFDPRAQTLVPGTVTTHTTGFLAGTWAQTSITGVFTANGEINFIINATVTSSIIPGIPYSTDYQIYVEYNVNTNTCYFSNYKL
jgi:hypothetical protein